MEKQKKYPTIPDVTKFQIELYMLPVTYFESVVYRNIHFTKNPDKYIKYSELEITAMIDGFYDSAA